jgi:hypothetical protein
VGARSPGPGGIRQQEDRGDAEKDGGHHRGYSPTRRRVFRVERRIVFT